MGLMLLVLLLGLACNLPIPVLELLNWTANETEKEEAVVEEANNELYGNADVWFDEGDCALFNGIIPAYVNQNWYILERTSFMGQARLNCRVNTLELREEPCGPGTDVICLTVPDGLNVSLTAYKSPEEAQKIWLEMREACPLNNYAVQFESGADFCLEMTDVQDDDYGTLYWRQLTQLEQNTIIQITQIDLPSSNTIYEGLEIARELINSYRDDPYLLP